MTAATIDPGGNDASNDRRLSSDQRGWQRCGARRSRSGLRLLHLSVSPFGQRGGGEAARLARAAAAGPGAAGRLYLLPPTTAPFWQALMNGLNGGEVRWEAKERTAWYDYAARRAANLSADYDVIVAHDPQALALAQVVSPCEGGPRWVWHCHLDTRSAA